MAINRKLTKFKTNTTYISNPDGTSIGIISGLWSSTACNHFKHKLITNVFCMQTSLFKDSLLKTHIFYEFYSHFYSRIIIFKIFKIMTEKCTRCTIQLCTTLFGRELPTLCHYWRPSVPIVNSQHIFDHPDKLMTWWSFLYCCWSKTLEQSASTSATAESKPWTILTALKMHLFVDAWLRRLVTFKRFSSAWYKYPYSLLTYLLT